MIYDYGKGSDKNWLLAADTFGYEESWLWKYETLMCLGNGYMCVRGSTEELYDRQLRWHLVAGTFDKPENDMTELPNFADFTGVDVYVDGQKMDLRKGVLSNYLLVMNYKTGVLSRSFDWSAPSGKQIHFESVRTVSMKNLHLYVTQVKVTSIDGAQIQIKSGIDTANRVGNLHFTKKKIIAKDYLQYIETTNDSGIDFVVSELNKCDKGEKTTKVGRKYVDDTFTANLSAGETMTLEKFATVYTMRDKEYEDGTLRKLKTVGKKSVVKASEKGAEALIEESVRVWKNKIWKNMDAKIDSKNDFDQLSYRFAVYHLTVMSPVHDNRMNIGAKGLSGPGYRGHAFWDTEIYMLPMFIFSRPDAARSLVESRYFGLEGAHKKAKDNGYEGAMFPWESAWITDDETTPSFARTGLLEHHITADVAYGVHCYYTVTQDVDFMEKYGYELIFDTAKYWQSRVTYNEKLDRYEICGVIGPDEYSEDVDNNAFTNYMAHLNLELAIKYYDELSAEHSEILENLKKKLDLERVYPEWKKKTAKLYLPVANEDGLVPQDDKFLTLDTYDFPAVKAGKIPFPEIDFAKTQISKQADVMVLFLLLEDLFTADVKEKNFYYYEACCMHHSSLSLSSYTVLAADVGLKDMAYDLYQRATKIDLGDAEMQSSNDGVHSASLGGIWQCVVFGFLGVRLYGTQLRIEPNLPDAWRSVRTRIIWHGVQLEVHADKKKLTVKRVHGTEPVSFLCKGKTYDVEDKVTVEY